MNRFRLIILFLLVSTIAKANSFLLQYSLGVTQDYNNQTTQSLQRAFFHEASFYYRLFKSQEFYLGLAYSMSSAYQTESDEASNTQLSNNPLLSLRYYIGKNQHIGFTYQYTPMAQLYQETEGSATNWSGSLMVFKPGIYIPMKKQFQLAIEFNYFMGNYTKKSVVSGSIPDTDFSRTHAIPSLGVIWKF